MSRRGRSAGPGGAYVGVWGIPSAGGVVPNGEACSVAGNGPEPPIPVTSSEAMELVSKSRLGIDPAADAPWPPDPACAYAGEISMVSDWGVLRAFVTASVTRQVAVRVALAPPLL